jgi:hypothetical protein
MQKNIARILICMKVASSILITDLILLYWSTASLSVNFTKYVFVILFKMLMYYTLFEIILKVEKTDSTGVLRISMRGDKDHSTDFILPDHYAGAGLRRISLIAT